MRVLVLGSAAGGGFPQWNCNCRVCQAARAGNGRARPRTQSSIAVSADGVRWALFNASPDLRQQITESPQMHPRDGARHSPIAAVVLTNADVDHIAGLLTLRESQPFVLYASRRVQDALDANPIFGILNPRFVRREMLALGQAQALRGPDGVELFEVMMGDPRSWAADPEGFEKLLAEKGAKKLPNPKIDLPDWLEDTRTS